MTQRTEIYRGADIVVVAALHADSPDAVITFSPLSDDRERRQGYGEALFKREKVSAVHFINLQNHWWQTPEMAKALAVVADLRLHERCRNVTAYGSSMGGHGALLFARALKANRALAMSPQFAIGGRNALWKPRWGVRDELFRFEDERSPDIRAVIAYDPYDRFDRSHVDAFRAAADVALVRVPFCHHDCAAALAEMRLLSRFVLDVVAGRDDLAALDEAIRARRRRSLICMSGLQHSLSRRAQRSRMFEAVHAANVQLLMAALDRGDNIHMKRTIVPVVAPYLAELTADGRPDRSIAIAERLHALHPNAPEIAFLLADQYAAAERRIEAYEVLYRCFRRNRNNAACAVRACSAALDAGLEADARRLLKAALALPRQDANAWVRFLRAFHDRLPHKTAVRIYRLAAALSPQHKNLKRVGALVRAGGRSCAEASRGRSHAR